MTFNDYLERATGSLSTKDNILSDGRTSCSYGRFHDLFADIDARFEESGVKPDERIAFEVSNTVPAALTLIYLLKNGYSFVLLPPLAPHAERTVQMATFRFCERELTIDNTVCGSELPSGSGRADFIRIMRFGGFSAGPEVGEKGGPTKGRPFRESAGDAGAERRDLDFGPAIFLRTSGTLGRPKLVVHSHEGLLGNALNCAERFALQGGSRISLPVPIFHMYGFGAAFLPGVLTGASIDLQENANILRYMDRERRFAPDSAFLTPTLCEMFLKGRRSSRGYDLVVTAGDRIRRETFEKFESQFGSLVSLYGTTEMGAIAASELGDPVDIRATTVGRPMDGVELRVKDSEQYDKGVSSGVMQCRHDYGFEGYMDGDGHWLGDGRRGKGDWFDTGDLGRVHESGYVEVLGRSDQSVNRSGILVFFSDIEGQFESIKEVEKVVVVAKGEGKWGKAITAFCVPRRNVQVNADQLRKRCHDLLPRYAIPDSIVIIESLPKLPSGKVDRIALAGKASSG
jgi:acyl-coenzyme A synthetase/AMP-(fatty) acid ligase